MYRQLRQWNEIYITIHIWVTIRVSRSSIITDVIETQAASAIAELHLERRWGYAWRPVVGTLKSEWNSKTVSSVRVTLTLSSGTSVFKGALTDDSWPINLSITLSQPGHTFHFWEIQVSYPVTCLPHYLSAKSRPVRCVSFTVCCLYSDQHSGHTFQFRGKAASSHTLAQACGM